MKLSLTLPLFLATLTLVCSVPISHSDLEANKAKGLRLLRLEDGVEPVWKTEDEKLDLIRSSTKFVHFNTSDVGRTLIYPFCSLMLQKYTRTTSDSLLSTRQQSLHSSTVRHATAKLSRLVTHIGPRSPAFPSGSSKTYPCHSLDTEHARIFNHTICLQ
jgi:hypothetical protein